MSAPNASSGQDWNSCPEELLADMTMNERMACLSSAWPGVPRLGVPAFRWGGECLHGLCHTGAATVFPIPLAMAATFDPALVHKVAAAIALEARARYFAETLPQTPFVSLAFWTPNINLLRDPRWGRGQETFGEDPFLTGTMGAAFVRGLQGDDPARLQVVACAKHFAVHSGPEAIRTSFDAKVSPKLLAETYLPHFRSLAEAGAATFMGAYNAVNGLPCCANPQLLGTTLREQWGFDGFVVSDAGAIAAFHRRSRSETVAAAEDDPWGFLARQMSELAGHGLSADAVESAALAVRAGCDMAIGSDLDPALLAEAVDRGILAPEDIDRAALRILRVAARLGILNAQGGRRPSEPGREVIQCRRHLRLARQCAADAIVLLKNNGVLPLQPDRVRTIAVSGPTAADLNVLLGNFYRGISGQLVTLVEGLAGGAPDGIICTFLQGCELYRENLHDSTWSIGLAENADVAVAVIGLSPLMEGEHGECIGSRLGGDRDAIGLPPVQLDYLRRLKNQSGKPLVVVVTGGSPLVLTEVVELADAVLLAWYPGEQGGLAVADVLFGRVNPSGRLPVSLPAAETDVPPFDDYSMVGRTYRYARVAPLFPFGFGLGYAPVAYGTVRIQRFRRKPWRASVEITNTGDLPARETVQLYIHLPSDPDGPAWNLRGFQKVTIQPRSTRRVSFPITDEMRRGFAAEGSLLPLDDHARIVLAPHAPVSEVKD